MCFCLSSNWIVSYSATEIKVRTLSRFNLHKRCRLISDEDLWEIWSLPRGPEENKLDRVPIDKFHYQGDARKHVSEYGELLSLYYWWAGRAILITATRKLRLTTNLDFFKATQFHFCDLSLNLCFVQLILTSCIKLCFRLIFCTNCHFGTFPYKFVTCFSYNPHLKETAGAPANWGVLLYGLSIRIAAAPLAFSCQLVALYSSGLEARWQTRIAK